MKEMFQFLIKIVVCGVSDCKTTNGAFSESQGHIQASDLVNLDTINELKIDPNI